MKKYNFSAGPSILPATVFEKAAQAVRNYKNTGLSLLEMSHRGPEFTEILTQARAKVKLLMHLNDDYEVLFLQGGASSQFMMVPYNILPNNGKAAYIDTGTWSNKAIKEAKIFGGVETIASSEESGFNYIPKNYQLSADSTYLHITTNNTIYGTEFHKTPDCNCFLVGDMSSDIFSRNWDYNKYDLIYAGAQKNMGPAGATLVVVKNEILGNVERQIPTMLDYRTHIKKGSAFNTPPVFPIYVSLLTMNWIEEQGGINELENRNKLKAETLYNEIDRNSLFKGFAAVDDRSIMNVTFTIEDKNREAAFVDHCSAIGIVGIKGHRSVGGFRASIYNAMDLEGVEFLVSAMQEFEKGS